MFIRKKTTKLILLNTFKYIEVTTTQKLKFDILAKNKVILRLYNILVLPQTKGRLVASYFENLNI